jgi:hypothetical protein
VALPRACRRIAVGGCAAPGCHEVIVEILTRAPDGCLTTWGKFAAPVEEGMFQVCVQAPWICCVRIVGACRIEIMAGSQLGPG